MLWKKRYVPCIRGKICLYCGGPAAEREHILPYSIHQKPWTVPACKQCNRFLGAKWHFTLGERCEFLIEAYRHRYQEDIEPQYARIMLGTTGQLRAFLEDGQHIKMVVQARIRYMDAMVALFGLIDLQTLPRCRESRRALQEFLDGARRTVPFVPPERERTTDHCVIERKEVDAIIEVLRRHRIHRGMNMCQIRANCRAEISDLDSVLEAMLDAGLVRHSPKRGWHLPPMPLLAPSKIT